MVMPTTMGAQAVNELTQDMRDFLVEQRYAVLATIREDGRPQQTVMWYELVDDYILMNTARGRLKDSNIQRDPRLSTCFEDGYRYLTLEGEAELVDDQEVAQADIKRLAVRYEGPEAGERMAAKTFSKQERVTIRLRIRHVIANGFD